jgi:branched-subunit amino acid ABC-type transport system permease component
MVDALATLGGTEFLLQLGIDRLIQGLYAGLSFGMILVLTAMGLSLVFGLMGVVNFAHGNLYAAGAYCGFVAYGVTGSFVGALVGAAVGGAVIGAALELLVIRPVYDRDPVYQMPLTFGAAIVIIESAKMFLGSDSKPFPTPDLFSGTFGVLGYSFGLYRLFLVVAGVLLVGSLWLFLSRTKYGLVIRAAINDTEMVQSMGYDVYRTYTLLFALGAVYAALAGILIAPLFGLFPEMGTEIIILSFIVVVVGGLGSFKGVVVSGLLMGVVISLGRVYVPNMAEALPFLLMIAVIAYRPRGLFGVEGVFTE